MDPTTLTDPHHELPSPPRPDFDAAALFLDLDGTLVDFAAHPDDVVVAPDLPRILCAAHDRFGGALAILSGRSLRRIDELLGLPSLAASGSHGAELRRADGTIPRRTRDAPGIASLRAYARLQLAEWPGVVVEDKPDAIALHWRAQPEARAAVQILARRIANAAGPRYHLQDGDCVVELRGAGTDKGDALARLMRQAPFAGRAPWMVGDDFTDEHAFAAAERLGGFGVIVGARRPTIARHAFSGAGAVRAWLASLVDATGAAHD
jgi:trehalose 6-phosphate phosphatase